MVDIFLFFQLGGVIDHYGLPIGGDKLVNNRGCGSEKIHFIFPLNTLAYDFHMQQPKEPAAKTESQCSRCFCFIGK